MLDDVSTYYSSSFRFSIPVLVSICKSGDDAAPAEAAASSPVCHHHDGLITAQEGPNEIVLKGASDFVLVECGAV